MKLSYEQLAVEVDKVYNQNTQESQADTAVAIISALIQAAGWTEDEYWEQWLSYHEGVDKLAPEPYVVQEGIN